MRKRMAFLAVLLWACEQPRVEHSPTPAWQEIQVTLTDGSLHNIHGVPMTGMPGFFKIGGDMVVRDAQALQKNGLGVNPATQSFGLWPEGKVYYLFDATVTEKSKQLFQAAIAEFESKTPLRFLPRTLEPNYIRVIEDTDPGSCWSFLGMVTGKQDYDLFCKADVSVAVHELGHAVGLLHEQSRIDRDQHVTVHWDNIAAPYRYAFDLFGYTASSFSPYDYRSIMHYKPFAFSTNGQETITSKNPQVPDAELGSSTGLSALDVASLQALYASPSLRLKITVQLEWMGSPGAFSTPVVNTGAVDAEVTGIKVDQKVLKNATLAPLKIPAGGQGQMQLDFAPCTAPGLFAGSVEVQLKGQKLPVVHSLLHICLKDTHTPVLDAQQGGPSTSNLSWYFLNDQEQVLAVSATVGGKETSVTPASLKAAASSYWPDSTRLNLGTSVTRGEEVCISLKSPTGPAQSSCYVQR